ncbi:MAG: flagellar hook-basal body complex protein FliE, partial [Xanthomonas perforans]|nr:flagellar hook-basal body complex protein FliE [Xanthomonas perforans]
MASSNFAAGAYAAVQGIGTGRPAPRIGPVSGTGTDFTQLLGQAIDQ